MFVYNFHHDMRRFGQWPHGTTLWEVCTIEATLVERNPMVLVQALWHRYVASWSGLGQHRE